MKDKVVIFLFKDEILRGFNNIFFIQIIMISILKDQIDLIFMSIIKIE